MCPRQLAQSQLTSKHEGDQPRSAETIMQQKLTAEARWVQLGVASLSEIV